MFVRFYTCLKINISEISHRQFVLRCFECYACGQQNGLLVYMGCMQRPALFQHLWPSRTGDIARILKLISLSVMKFF